VRITLYESELNRNLSHDWHFPKREIAEWYMSEAQWAAFVSSFNLGSGVPVTLVYVDNDEEPHKPFLPTPDIRREFSDEVKQTLMGSIQRLRSLEERIKSSGLSKKKQDDLLTDVRMSLQEIERNIPFVKETFDKHVETSVEKAKVEVHAYVNNTLVHAGLQTLQGKVLQIEDKRLENENRMTDPYDPDYQK
jgi:hypothetical protein